MKHERFIPSVECGLRVREAAEGEQSRMIDGTPIVFGQRSVNLTPWSKEFIVYEVLERGCISQDLLNKSDVLLNLNHDPRVTQVLGRWRFGEGTLGIVLNEDNVECSCDMPRTNAANDTLELIHRGDISGMSFAFRDNEDDPESVVLEPTGEVEDGKEVWIRRVKRIIGLYDVSIVTHPAYEQTSVGTREQGDKMLESIAAKIREREDKPKNDAAAEAAKREEELMKAQERERKIANARRRTARRHMMNY